MASKRNLSSCSEPEVEIKKKNIQSTPNKIIMEDTTEGIIQHHVNIEREEAIENVKKNAPQWFGDVFDFMLKDLNRISEYAKQLTVYQAQCEKNNEEIQVLHKKVEELEKKNSALQDNILRLESYSRKNNLIIKGLSESGPNEDVTQRVIEFMSIHLKMAAPQEVILETAHRLGKPPHLQSKPVKKPRDIIVRFLRVADRDKAWNLRFNLKNTPYILGEDYPSGIQEKRRQLQPFFHMARKHPSVKKCQLNGDVLIINGSRYTVATVETLPFGLYSLSSVPTSEKKLQKREGTAFFGKNSFLSNFHYSPFEDNGHSFSTVEHYYQYRKALYFKDETTASTILHSHSPAQAKALSYQIQDYDEELWRSVAEQTMYNACSKKFQQNITLRTKLKGTRGLLVEANPKDNFFSCGLSIDDPNLDETLKWKGQNILGNILIKIRDSL